VTSLSTPLRLTSGVTLPNRIAKAATEEALADAAGDPTPALAHLYERWSRGGAGLLLTGHVIVDRAHRGRPRDVVLEDDRALDRFRTWANAARVAGNAAFMQINHAGRQTPRTVNGRPAAPSAGDAVRMLGSFAPPRAMHASEIHEVARSFVRAAVLAERAGFDGVQIHAAHGYLLSQFLSPLTNHRTDAYGGSVENRARLLLEIVRGIRAEAGQGGRPFAVSVKINSADFQRGGFDASDFRVVAAMLDDAGIDLLEISGGNYESFAPFEGHKSERTRAREAYFLEFAREIRDLVKVPIMLTGGFLSRDAMASAMADGVDVIGMARPLILEPELPTRLIAGLVARAALAIEPKRRTPRSLVALAEGSWYWAQIARIARGGEPDRHMSTWRAILAYLAYDFSTGFFGGSHARPALPAAAPAD
jgi:2,4-dienoyl-CoA reductase-like NADH-dependent reductase (Old Yellow Enzyme family)